MISPVGLVLAAVASLGAYLAHVSGAGSKWPAPQELVHVLCEYL